MSSLVAGRFQTIVSMELLGICPHLKMSFVCRGNSIQHVPIGEDSESSLKFTFVFSFGRSGQWLFPSPIFGEGALKLYFPSPFSVKGGEKKQGEKKKGGRR